jgi:Flp pilus assembly protein TadG
MEEAMMRVHKRRERQRGNSMIEFALCATFLVPLLLGSMTVGINLGRSLQVSQVARDTGHMYARQTDFSLVGSQEIVVRIAQGLGMTRTGGDGVVILSKILKVGDAQCTAGGVSLAACTNNTKSVVTQRIVVGNSLFGVSKFATPASTLIATNGDIAADKYLKEASVVVTDMNSILTTQNGDEAYLVECYFKGTDFLNPGGSTKKIYSRALF